MRPHPLRHCSFAAFALLLACASRAPEPSRDQPPTKAAAQLPAQAAAQPLESPQAEPRKFGAEPKLPGEPIPVEQLLREPDAHLGKHIKCAGKVARVCQNAGCWLELQAESGGEGLRVPMANHAFFIPKDAAGRHAVIEGELQRLPLRPEMREHYESEGMQAIGPLALEATTVLLH